MRLETSPTMCPKCQSASAVLMPIQIRSKGDFAHIYELYQQCADCGNCYLVDAGWRGTPPVNDDLLSLGVLTKW
jgi:hypothetical protein